MRYTEAAQREPDGALRRSVGATTPIPMQWLGKRPRLDPLLSMVTMQEVASSFPLVFSQGRPQNPDPAKGNPRDAEIALDAWRSLNEQLRMLGLGTKDIDVRDVEPAPELLRLF